MITKNSINASARSRVGKRVGGRILLIGGLAAVVLGVVGMAAAPDLTGEWFDHPHAGMMGGWNGGDRDGPSPPRISGAKQVNVQAGEFVFDPSRIEIRADEPVNIRLVNRGGLVHDFSVEGLAFRLSAVPGEQAIAGLEATDPGSYRFLCTVPGHAAAGMVGTLVVR